MKRLGGIWSQLVSFENLLNAYYKARRGKRDSTDVAEFTLNLEGELIRLQQELIAGEYQPGHYRLFTIYERKPRLIAAAPFRDRVVHHAIMNCIEAPLDRTFIFDSYACRKGKGVHKAVERYQGWAQRYTYVLKMDVAQYFPSIDHDILKEKLCRRIKDRQLLKLLGRIIDGSPASAIAPYYFTGDDLLTPIERRYGIAIGNLTSQFFANLYLDDLDHHIKHFIGVKAYLRYVDDMVVIEDDKSRLSDIRAMVCEHLAADRLQLHPRKAHISPVVCGLDLLGYFVYPKSRRLRNDNGHRFSRKLRHFAQGYAEGKVGWKTINASVQSWVGHSIHAETEGLRRAIFSQVVFRRGGSREAANV